MTPTNKEDSLIKICILGSGPAAICAASHFLELGAQVKIFSDKDFLETTSTLIEDLSEFEKMVADLGLRNFYEKRNVVRVHKQFLHPGQKIAERSRMCDDFRVVFEVGGKEWFKEKVQEDQNYEGLDDFIKGSLQTRAELYENFDSVIDARDSWDFPNEMGPGVGALNEKALKINPQFHYGVQALKNKLESGKQKVIVGSGSMAALKVASLMDWLLEDKGHELYVVSNEEKAFVNLLNGSEFDKKAMAKLEISLARHKESQAKEWEVHKEKVQKWNELEDYEKVKIGKPLEPLSRLKIFSGYQVFSIDYLADRECYYLSLEKSPFFEIEGPDIRTIPADQIYCLTGHSRHKASLEGLEENEDGFYYLGNLDYNIDKLLKEVKKIEIDLLKYFSKS